MCCHSLLIHINKVIHLCLFVYKLIWAHENSQFSPHTHTHSVSNVENCQYVFWSHVLWLPSDSLTLIDCINDQMALTCTYFHLWDSVSDSWCCHIVALICTCFYPYKAPSVWHTMSIIKWHWHLHTFIFEALIIWQLTLIIWLWHIYTYFHP